jgi:hypothetical protein
LLPHLGRRRGRRREPRADQRRYGPGEGCGAHLHQHVTEADVAALGAGASAASAMRDAGISVETSARPSTTASPITLAILLEEISLVPAVKPAAARATGVRSRKGRCR